MKISILTPCFNSERYIKRAIHSVLIQDYKNYEHIIMDGGSTDGTIEILKKYPHLIWESAPDNGQSDAMNKALKKATGDIIIFLNADDELAENLLTEVSNNFAAFPQADMIVGNLTMDNRGNIALKRPSTSLSAILNYWPCRFPLNPVSYAYKKSLHAKIGYYPTDNHYAMDYWFLLRVYLFGKVIKTEFVCGTYYIDGTNKSTDVGRSKHHLRKVRNEFLRQYFYKSEVFAYLLKFLPLYFLKILGRLTRKVHEISQS